jgi:hypothetical protein
MLAEEYYEDRIEEDGSYYLLETHISKPHKQFITQIVFMDDETIQVRQVLDKNRLRGKWKWSEPVPDEGTWHTDKDKRTIIRYNDSEQYIAQPLPKELQHLVAVKEL